MSSDPAIIAVLQSEWAGVVKMRERMQLLTIATFSFGAPTGPALAKVVYNLPATRGRNRCQLRGMIEYDQAATGSVGAPNP